MPLYNMPLTKRRRFAHRKRKPLKKLASKVKSLMASRPLNFYSLNATWFSLPIYTSTSPYLQLINLVPQVNQAGGDALVNGQRIHSNVTGKRLRGALSCYMGTTIYPVNNVRIIIFATDHTAPVYSSIIDSSVNSSMWVNAPYNKQETGIGTGKAKYGPRHMKQGDYRILYDKRATLSLTGQQGHVFFWDIDLHDLVTTYTTITGNTVAENQYGFLVLHDDQTVVGTHTPVCQWYNEFIYVD